MEITIRWGVVKGSIWDRLQQRLGREPTNAEARAEVERIKAEGLIKAATAGRLPHQRKR